MGNICDGAMWPLKAVPQTLLQVYTIMQVSDGACEVGHCSDPLLQSSRGQLNRINELLGSISRRIEFLFKLFAQRANIEDNEVNSVVEAFFG